MAFEILAKSVSVLKARFLAQTDYKRCLTKYMPQQNANAVIYTVLLLVILTTSCKSRLHQEAQSNAAVWWNATIAKCGDSYFTKTDRPLYLGVKLFPIKVDKAYIEFKNVYYDIEELPLEEDEKLNDFEWKGQLTIQPLEPTFRYYDLDESSNDKKWSPWKQDSILYTHADKLSSSSILSPSPQLRFLRKVKGEWSGFKPANFNKPDCSEIPRE